MPRIGEKVLKIWAMIWLLVLPVAPSFAAEVEFSAQLDREQISIDESVSVKLTLLLEGTMRMGDVHFKAPDFDVVNEYSGSSVSSYYDGTTGRFGMKNTQQLTKILKPNKTGNLRITSISAVVNGKTYSAADLVVQVVGSGAATPPPRGYGGGGIGLRGAVKRTSSGPSVKVRAEVSKDRVFKGEQVIVSYYLYRRVRVFNIQVEKFPVLSGFLREDLEMPVLGQRIDTERVILDGAPYERSLLMRYAAYPLQDGKLKIDSAALKYNYYGTSNSLDEEDPFMGFFRQMNPQQGSDRSEMLSIDVEALPEQGKPNSFTGGVGDFTISSAVDKYDVKANEALTLTFKVEGRGNLAAVGEPKAKWPDQVELYDSKGVAKAGRQGVGEKVFEFVLIPRVAGQVILPPLEFSYFDPAKKSYVTRSTEPITIRVAEGSPGSGPARIQTPGGVKALTSSETEQKPVIFGLKPPELVGGRRDFPAWRWIYWLFSLVVFGLAGVIAYDWIKRSRMILAERSLSRAKIQSRSWERLSRNARSAVEGASWQEVVQTYELLVGVMFEAIDQVYTVSARSRPRAQLQEILVEEYGMSLAVWKRIARLLEYAETVRFAASAGAVSEAEARSELIRWVSEGQGLVREICQKS
ncbi:BatD family protein [Bdellovibrionota bacterium FG-1]